MKALPTFNGLATITGSAWVKSGLSSSLNWYYLQAELHMDLMRESVFETSI